MAANYATGDSISVVKYPGEICLVAREKGKNRYDSLPKDKLHKFVKKYQKTGDLEARRKVLESHMRFVLGISRKFTNKGFGLAEIVDQGTIGLCRAVEKHDSTKGDFTMYASYWVHASILDMFRDSNLSIRIPGSIGAKLNRARKFIDRYYSQHEKYPSLEVLEKMGVTQKILDLLNTMYGNLISLDSEMSTGDTLHEYELPELNPKEEKSPLGRTIENETLRFVDDALVDLNKSEDLSDRDIEMFCRYYNLSGMKETYQRIGEDFGVCRETVRLAIEKVKRAVRIHLEDLVESKDL